MELKNKIVVVAGAAAGIGRADATRLAATGADLVLADIEAGGLAGTAQRVKALGCRAVAVRCDGAAWGVRDHVLGSGSAVREPVDGSVPHDQGGPGRDGSVAGGVHAAAGVNVTSRGPA